MRITYTEGVGIPIENLSDHEVEELERLLDERSAKNWQRLIAERRARDAAVAAQSSGGCYPSDPFFGFFYG